MIAQTDASLPEVRVAGSRDGASEGTRSYVATKVEGATGLGLSMRETPQSVSVITRQRLDDQAIQTMDQALTSSTGLTFQQYDNAGRITYRARGFEISNYRIDGLSIDGGTDLSSGQGPAVNMDLYDRIEVVRGATGLLGGAGDPSASINLIRKKPTKAFAASAGVTLGSWGKKRITGDISTPINADGSVRGRVVVSKEDSGSYLQRQKVDNTGALVSIEADLGRATTLTAGLQYEKNRTDGATWGTNVPIWYADGSLTHLPRSTNPVTDWSYAERESRTLFGELTHRFDGGWRARVAAAHSSNESISNMGVAKVNNLNASTYAGFWKQNGTGAVLNAFHAESESQRNSVEATVSGPFAAFGRTHEFTAGVNGYRAEVTSYTFSNALGNCNIAGVTPYSGCQYRARGLPISNWQTWDGSYANFNTFRTNARSEATTTDYGGYAASRLSISDPLTAILGARVSNYKTHTDAYSAIDAVTSGAASGNRRVLTPYAGVVYDINATYSAYASYTDVFKPQSSKDASGNYLDPVTGQSYEAGVKGEFLNGRLNASAAVFSAKQKNVAQRDGNNTTPDGAQAFVANGTGVKARGVEFDASGQLLPGWNIYAGYTYLDVENPSSADRLDPRHLLRLNTTYRLSGAFNRLTLGGGVSAQSSLLITPLPGRPLSGGGYDATPLKSGGYVLVNLMARYAINDKLTATLNIDNLFDRTYYRQYGFYDGLIYGEPRRITLGLQARF